MTTRVGPGSPGVHEHMTIASEVAVTGGLD